jgi:uncharacterized protein (DUF2336 family)
MCPKVPVVEDLLTLKSLAYNRTTLARASLFEKISGLWLDDAAKLSGPAQEAMDQILADLVKDVEGAVRARVAEGLAAKPDVPPKLIETLATDPDIMVSGPLLTCCTMLAEKLLLRVARDGGVVHRQAIAKREAVPIALSDALCERREAAVMKTLIGNPGAKLSRAVFREAMVLAKTDDALRDALLSRTDTPKDFAYRMFWWVSAALRTQILSRYALDPQTLDGVLREMLAELGDDRISAVGEQKAAAPKPSGRTFNTVVHALNGAGLRAFVQELSAAAGVTPETAARIANDTGGECLAVAARALGADRAQFTSLVLQLDFKRYGKARPPSVIEPASAAFDAIDERQARAVMTLWNAQFRAAA